jgi:hypothetical protein
MDLRAIADNPRAFVFPMRWRALRNMGLVEYTEQPRPPRDTSRRQRPPAPRAKVLTEKGRMELAMLERHADERRAIAGATAARHAARDDGATS